MVFSLGQKLEQHHFIGKIRVLEQTAFHLALPGCFGGHNGNIEGIFGTFMAIDEFH